MDGLDNSGLTGDAIVHSDQNVQSKYGKLLTQDGISSSVQRTCFDKR